MADRIKSSESIKYDYDKARALYSERGYVTYHVWEDSVDTDMELLISYINTLTEIKSNNE